jgi:hypothetical protein
MVMGVSGERREADVIALCPLPDKPGEIYRHSALDVEADLSFDNSDTTFHIL